MATGLQIPAQGRTVNPDALNALLGRAVQDMGAQAGPARLEKVARDGGFTNFRKATETPFNMVFEARG
jgi:hypothetical protein